MLGRVAGQCLSLVVMVVVGAYCMLPQTCKLRLKLCNALLERLDVELAFASPRYGRRNVGALQRELLA